ncbi:Abi family protein [Hwanghaeella sp. LZ110]|uniref:Abi family protein n=1 Tax=Hwanghaeella sp. LZ110 TaxID=3402810 RepID=UPI003B683B8E
MRYDEPALTLIQQITMLRQRGLIIPDDDFAQKVLRFVGFFRMRGYFLPFREQDANGVRGNFKLGTTFTEIVQVYIFDRKLRLLVMDAMERIEVASRTVISNEMSVQYGPHWYLESRYFRRFDHDKYISDIRNEIGSREEGSRHRDSFIASYYEQYCEPDLPPSWMIFEVLPFGYVSKTYSRLAPEPRKQIAEKFDVSHRVLESWLHTLSSLRNLCAHHSRLWNRNFGVRPKKYKPIEEHFKVYDRFYAQAVVIKSLLDSVAGHPKWAHDLANLLDESSFIDPTAMGFPPQWRTTSLWNIEESM